MLQRHLRGLVSKAKSARVALYVYEKYIDDETGKHYWFNSRTGVAHWEKPAGLRWNDIGNPVRMPEADTRFEVPCVNCMATCVSCYCAECASAESKSSPAAWQARASTVWPNASPHNVAVSKLENG